MRYIRLLSAAAALVSGVVAADLSCESVTTAGTYNWSDPAAWNCYGQGRVAVPDEYPGKNYPTNNYIAYLGSWTEINAVTEHAMNVDTVLGLGGKGYANYSASAAVDNGAGLIRVTIATNAIATGDKVFCSGFNGNNPNKVYGIWTATVIDTTHIDLQGSDSTGVSGATAGGCQLPPAIMRSGKTASKTTVAKWKINAGVTATFNGDVIDNWYYTPREDETYAMVRCGDSVNGGCTWIWGVHPGAATGGAYRLLHATTGAPGAYRNLRMFFRGTPSRRAVITSCPAPCSTPPAMGGRFSPTNVSVGGDVWAEYADFSYLGHSTYSGGGYFSFYAALEASSTWHWKHFTISGNTAYLYLAGSVFPDAATVDSAGNRGDFTMAYGVFDATSCSGNCIAGPRATSNYVGWDGSQAITCASQGYASPCLVIGPAVAFLKAVAVTAGGADPMGLILDRNYIAGTSVLYNVSASNKAVGSAIRNTLLAKTIDQGGLLGAETIQNNYFWQGKVVSSNNHGWSVPAVSGGAAGTIQLSKFVFEGNVLQFEEGQIDGAGNIMDEVVRNSYPNGANPAISVYWRNNIDIPNTDWDGTLNNWTSINSMARVGPPPGMIWRYYNNTHFTSNDSIAGLQLDHVGTEPYAGAVAEFRCNAVATPTGNTTMAGSSNPTTLIGVETTTLASIPVDSADPTGLHHNAAFGYLGRRANMSWLNGNAAYGTVYGIPLSQTPAGVANGTDQYYDNRMPQVVDRTRRLRGWVNQKYRQSFTDDRAALAYLRADVNGDGPTRLLDIPDLVAWVRAGWTLDEPTLYKACGDGTHIGAAVAPPTVNPGVSGVIVAGERRGNAPPIGPAKGAGRAGDAIVTTAPTNGIRDAALTDTADLDQLRPDLFEELRTDLFRDVLPVAALRDLVRDIADVLGASRKTLTPLR